MVSLAARNNNPGNIEFGRFARSYGSPRAGQGSRFAYFPTPEAGLAAIVALQHRYETTGAQTITERILRWAPPSNENSRATVQNYINTIAKTMGIDPNTPFSITDPTLGPKFLTAMSGFESGYAPYTPEQINAGFQQGVAKISGAGGPVPPGDIPGIAPSGTVLKPNSRANDPGAVSALQQRLAAGGFYNGRVDGIYGKGTEAAVKAFQSASGLAADGVAGPRTLTAVGLPGTDTRPVGFTQSGGNPFVGPGMMASGDPWKAAYGNQPTPPGPPQFSSSDMARAGNGMYRLDPEAATGNGVWSFSPSDMARGKTPQPITPALAQRLDAAKAAIAPSLPDPLADRGTVNSRLHDSVLGQIAGSNIPAMLAQQAQPASSGIPGTPSWAYNTQPNVMRGQQPPQFDTSIFAPPNADPTLQMTTDAAAARQGRFQQAEQSAFPPPAPPQPAPPRFTMPGNDVANTLPPTSPSFMSGLSQFFGGSTPAEANVPLRPSPAPLPPTMQQFNERFGSPAAPSSQDFNSRFGPMGAANIPQYQVASAGNMVPPPPTAPSGMGSMPQGDPWAAAYGQQPQGVPLPTAANPTAPWAPKNDIGAPGADNFSTIPLQQRLSPAMLKAQTAKAVPQLIQQVLGTAMPLGSIFHALGFGNGPGFLGSGASLSSYPASSRSNGGYNAGSGVRIATGQGGGPSYAWSYNPSNPTQGYYTTSNGTVYQYSRT